MDGIGKTSLLVAAMRAAETKRPESEGRLFSDPFAENLAGEEGRSLLAKAIAASGDQPAIAIRTFFIDQKMNSALSKGVRQIVMLAAGMDSRAFRMSFPGDTRIFEIDRKEVLEYKKQKLQNAQPQCERKVLEVDLREEWQNQLREAGWNSKEQSLWLVEGLLMYLEVSQVTKLFERINTLAKPNDIMLFDILSRTLLEAPYMKKQLDFLTSIGAPWRFGTDEPQNFMKKFGWKAELSQAGEVAPSRWPFPAVPLDVPNVPRGFFVEATKTVSN
jgi:methyltransferase (TIGR00027 family)